MANQIYNFNSAGLSQRNPLGGFRHWAGLQPLSAGSGDPFHASVRIFHVPASNGSAIFKGDIVKILGTGGGDLYQNEFQYGGPGQGNPAIAGDVGVVAPGDTTSTIAGVVVGYELTLFAAKNGFPQLNAGIEGWLHVDTDPALEMAVTAGGNSLPSAGWAASIGAGIDILARNTTYQSLKFGISGLAVDPTTIATTATLPLRVLGASMGISDDVTDAPTGTPPNTTGNPVVVVGFNSARHMRGSGAFVA